MVICLNVNFVSEWHVYFMATFNIKSGGYWNSFDLLVLERFGIFYFLGSEMT